MYEETLEDNGRFNEQPVLPFNAYGTIAMARSEFEANDGSSQIFFLLKVPSARRCVALTAALSTAKCWAECRCQLRSKSPPAVSVTSFAILPTTQPPRTSPDAHR